MAKKKGRFITHPLVPPAIIVRSKQWKVRVVQPSIKTDWTGETNFATQTITIEDTNELGETLLHEVLEIILDELGTVAKEFPNCDRDFILRHRRDVQADIFSEVVRELHETLKNNVFGGQSLGRIIASL